MGRTLGSNIHVVSMSARGRAKTTLVDYGR